MKGRVIVLGEIEGHEVAALLEDGRLEDLALDDDAAFTPGSILRGTVGRPVKGLGGVFVDLPEGQSGFLRAPKGLRPGQSILVQITGVAEEGKAFPLTQRLLFKSRYAIVTPDAPGLNVSRAIRDEDIRKDLTDLATEAMTGADESLGLILRSVCEEAAEDEIADDILQVRGLAEAVLKDVDGKPELLVDAPGPHELAWRDWGDADEVDESPEALDHHGVLDQLAALSGPEVRLEGGASMWIEATRAFVAVDVNTGPDTSPAAGLKASIAAARDLPRQLRLRGLGGMVLVDFAPCPKRDRHVLEQVLNKAFRADAGEASMAGWTPLGNFELARRRDRAALPGWVA
ncbi:ribonuclease E/G [Pararhodobacter sp. CCB-MM2]|uniref:ribonuclease E/G n=1 Tax=Pararhodobacter sp. CCB-MM2 TaxID=1786003 RepID=UPI00083050E7|nr:ribonuclease E/G [Pararhodobacter sp. CCB-MM2]